MNIVPRREQQSRRSMYLSSNLVTAVEQELYYDLQDAGNTIVPLHGAKTSKVNLQYNTTSVRPHYVLNILESAYEAQEAAKKRSQFQSTWRKFVSRIKKWMAHMIYRYFGLMHLAYFTCLAFIGSFLVEILERKNSDVSYLDALFVSTSCVATSGLMTVDYTYLSSGTKVVLFVLSIIGSPIFDSIFMMVLKRWLWTKPYVISNIEQDSESFNEKAVGSEERSSSSSSSSSSPYSKIKRRRPHMKQNKFINILTDNRIVQFHALITNNYEKSALTILIAVAIGYWFIVQFLMFLLILFIEKFGGYKIETSENVDMVLSSFVLTLSSFSGVGLSPYKNSAVPFRNNPSILLALTISMALGNSLLPLGLRFAVWIVKKAAASTEDSKRGRRVARLCEQILRFPRRLTTSLLPRKQTIYLCLVIVSLDIIGMVSILSNDSASLSGMPTYKKIVNALFDVSNTRQCGFSTVTSLSSVSPCTMALLTVLMYIGPIPNIVAMRSSRDRGELEDENKDRQTNKSKKNKKDEYKTETDYGSFRYEYLKENAEFHLKRILFYDLAWIFFSWYALCLIENENIRADDDFDVFKFLFESISAYSMVGLSLGYKYVEYSLAGTLRPQSKFVLIVLMMMGRHRYLPDNIDQAMMPACMPVGNAKTEKTLISDYAEEIFRRATFFKKGGYERAVEMDDREDDDAPNEKTYILSKAGKKYSGPKEKRRVRLSEPQEPESHDDEYRDGVGLDKYTSESGHVEEADEDDDYPEISGEVSASIAIPSRGNEEEDGSYYETSPNLHEHRLKNSTDLVDNSNIDS